MNQITSWNQYVPLAMRTLAPLDAKTQLAHSRMGMATEIGELIDGLKRAIAYGKPLDVANIREEIGDIAWYVALECQNTGAELDLRKPAGLAPLSLFGELEVCFSILRTVASITDRPSSPLLLEFIMVQLWHICETHGIDFYQCLGMNIAKLSLRYGDKFSDVAALVRDLQAERKLLEGN